MARVTRKVLQQLDGRFEAKAGELMERAGVNAQAMGNTGQARYEEMDGGEGLDRFNPAQIHSLYDRSEISSKYVDVHTEQDGKTGTTKEGIVLKLQHDWLGVLERDMHLRKRTRVRLEAHAASRARGVGNSNGPVNNGIIRFLSLLLAIEP